MHTTYPYTTAVVDECPESCGDNAYCSPTTGYECQCLPGFTGNADIHCTGRKCIRHQHKCQDIKYLQIGMFAGNNFAEINYCM